MNVSYTSRSLIAVIGIACLTLLAAVPAVQAKDKFPRPIGAVNDFAGVIPADKKNRMENLAREVLAKTGTAIVVAVVKTIGDDEINDYVNRLYAAWGIGKKGENKGVLLFVTVQERKMRIETGYGVEGILPDGLVGEIRDTHMIPFFRQQDYGQGLLNGMIAIASIVARDANVTLTGSPFPESPRPTKKAKKGQNFSPLTIVLVIIVLAFLLGSRQGRDMLPFLLGFLLSGGGRGGSDGGGFGSFGGGGFGGFGGGESGGGGAGGDF
jgi:uncharacterized protein